MKITKYLQRLLVLCLGIVFLITASGCKGPVPKKAAPRTGRLTVFVPCSILGAFTEILDLYKKEHPGAKVDFDTGNSVVLMRKITEKGARPDIYIATGPLEMEPVAVKGLIDAGDIVPLTQDSIILVTPASNPKNIRQLPDLLKEEVKSIAIPDPKVNSSGRFAVDALTMGNFWNKIKNKVIFTESGRISRNYIFENKIDAAIIYKSCLYEDLKAYDDVTVPKEIYVVVDILKLSGGNIPSPAAILNTSKNKELAKDFLEYMQSEKAKEILKKWAGKEIINQ